MDDSRIAARIGGSLLLIGAIAFASFVVGLVFGAASGLALLSILLLLMLVSHLRHMHALGRWMERGEAPDPPLMFGVWDDLHALLHRSRREAGRREAELARSIARWRDAARALPDGVVILEGDRIEWCNDTAQLHLQLDLVRDAGMSLTNLIRVPEFSEYLEATDHSKPVQLRLIGDRVLSVQVVEYGDAQRLVLTRDVTRFEMLEKVRREFVANVSHELRTPLTVISGFLETLRDDSEDEAMRDRFLALMSEQARRMHRLVEDLLTLSSLESSPPPPMEEPIDMSALVERLGAEARALSGGRHKIEIVNEAPLDLLGSEKEINSAFANLVSNAIRYTPEGGTVRLLWRAVPDGAAFDVQDSGIGIASEHIPRLTERFYRVDRGRSRETGGTGLGLAIVKHALGRHGAALDIASAPGQGSQFSARFAGPRLRMRA